MDLIANTFKKVSKRGKDAFPKAKSAAEKGMSTLGNFGARLLKSSSKGATIGDITSLLSQTDIKYGDENLLNNDDAVYQYLGSDNPQDTLKALNTILAILVYCTNVDYDSGAASTLDSALDDEEDFRTRIMKKFYPGVVKCINSDNKEVKKLALLIITQTFTEDSDATILCLNSLLKEVGHKDPERRANGLRLMSSIANNEIYPFIYTHILKGMNDLNPFVRRCAYAGLLKLRKNTEFGSTQNYVPDDNDESEEDEEEISTDDLCLRLLNNTLHNLTEEEQEVGGQSIKPEQNENILAISLYLLSQIIQEENSNTIESKYKTIHPVYFLLMEKLSEIDEIFISQITPVLIRYTKRYFGNIIEESRKEFDEEKEINKQQEKILYCITNALEALDSPSAILALVQFFIVVSPIQRIHEVTPHLIRAYKQVEIEGGFENYLTGFSILHFIETILKNKALIKANPKVLKNFTSLRFVKNLFLKTNQPQYYCSKKLVLLDLICDSIRDNSAVRKIILDEFYYQSKNNSPIIALQSVEAIKNCGMERNGIEQSSKSMFYPSVKYMVRIVKTNKDDRVLGRCVQNLHIMLLKDQTKTPEIVYYLVSMLDKLTSPSARARVIRLVIDFINYFKTSARETFRKLVKNFLNEKLQVKFQILQLGITLMMIKFEDGTEKLEKIFNYLLKVALADADYGLKMFTRLVKGIFDRETMCDGTVTVNSIFSKAQSNGHITPSTISKLFYIRMSYNFFYRFQTNRG